MVAADFVAGMQRLGAKMKRVGLPVGGHHPIARDSRDGPGVLADRGEALAQVAQYVLRLRRACLLRIERVRLGAVAAQEHGLLRGGRRRGDGRAAATREGEEEASRNNCSLWAARMHLRSASVCATPPISGVGFG